MEYSHHLLYFFFLIFIGYGATCKRWLSDSLADHLPSLLTHICYPAMIVYTFSQIRFSRQWSPSFSTVTTALIVSITLLCVTKICLRGKPRTERYFLQFMLNIGNITYIGIPIFSIFLPESTLSIFILLGTLQDFLIWLYFYPALLASHNPPRLGTLLVNPCIFSLFLGLILAIFSLPLPAFFQTSFRGLSEMTMPLAALYFGMLIARYGIRTPLQNTSALKYAFIKSILIPLCIALLLLPLCGIRTSLLLALFFGCPAPLLGIVWAREHDMDLPFVRDCCIVSTLLFLPVSTIALAMCTTTFSP